jgi:hypothetical protein
MRFISLFFEENIRNMVTRHTNGRDVAVEFQGLPRGMRRGGNFTRCQGKGARIYVSVK